MCNCHFKGVFVDQESVQGRDCHSKISSATMGQESGLESVIDNWCTPWIRPTPLTGLIARMSSENGEVVLGAHQISKLVFMKHYETLIWFSVVSKKIEILQRIACTSLFSCIEKCQIFW